MYLVFKYICKKYLNTFLACISYLNTKKVFSAQLWEHSLALYRLLSHNNNTTSKYISESKNLWSNLHTNRINLIEPCHEIHLSEKKV